MKIRTAPKTKRSEQMALKTRFTVIYGHYGSGKTNIALNMAFNSAKKDEKVTIVDLDIVNPYFRTCDYKEMLEEKGIHVITTGLAGSTLDVPAIQAETYSVFSGGDDHVIFDVGGDDAGAYAIGRFSKLIAEAGNYEALYVINKYRKLVSEPELAAEILREIEAASRIKATALINNSHLCGWTSTEDIIDSLEYMEKTSELTKLPVKYLTVPEALEDELRKKINDKFLQDREKTFEIYPVDIIVTPPFEI